MFFRKKPKIDDSESMDQIDETIDPQTDDAMDDPVQIDDQPLDVQQDTSLTGQMATQVHTHPKRKRRLRKKRVAILVIILILIIALVLWFIFGKQKSTSVTYEYIRTTTLTKTSLSNTVTATGTVVSGSEANVTVADGAKTYKIATVEVEVGDVVNAGDVIATLDTTDLQKQIQQAQQSYTDDVASAQTTYDRAWESYNNAVSSHDSRLVDLQEAIDQAKEDVEDAETDLSNAKSARDYAQNAVNDASSKVNELAGYYNNTQSLNSVVSTYNSACDQLISAVDSLNKAYETYQSAYMAYTSYVPSESTDDGQGDTDQVDSQQRSLWESLERAVNDLNNAWNNYGTGNDFASLESENNKVSQQNQRVISNTSAQDPVSVNVQISSLTCQNETLPSLSVPSSNTLVENAKTAAMNLSTAESNAVNGSGMTYEQLVQAYSDAQNTLSEKQTILNQRNNEVTSAESALEMAETTLESAQDSYDSEANGTTVTTAWQNVEDATTRLEQAKRTPSNLETLRDTLSDCTLTATMSGTITALNATVGSVCADTVATIQNTEGLMVEITLSADDVTTVKTGMDCTIASDATGDKVIEGTLVQVDPVANSQGTFGAKVEVDGTNSGLLIGIQAQVSIILENTDNVFVVPLDAVGENSDGSQYVYRQTGGEGVNMIFEQVEVTTGASNDYYTEISGDDLKEGDVIRSSSDLSEGIESVETNGESEIDMDGMMPGGGSMPDMSDFGGSMPNGDFSGTMPSGDFGGSGGITAGGPGGM